MVSQTEAGSAEWVGALSPLVRAGGWMVGGRGLQLAVSFLANLILVRLLSPADFGHFAIVAANVGIVSSVVNFRLEDVLLRVRDTDLRHDRLAAFGTALMVEVTGIVVGSLIVVALFGLLDFAAVLLIAGSATGSWVGAQSALYERNFQYRNLSLVQTTGRILGHVAAVTGAAAGLGPIVLYLRSLIQVLGIGVGLCVLGALRSLPFRALRLSEWRFLWARVRGFWGDGILEQAFERLVILTVGLAVGEQVTGFFYQARFLAGVPQSVLGPFTFRIRMNQFAHHTDPPFRVRAALRGVLVTALPILGATALAFWLANPLVPWLLGAAWQRCVPLLLAMLGLIPGLTLIDTLRAYFMAEEDLHTYLWIGRGGQYLGAITGSVAAFWAGSAPARALAFGLSSAYVIPVVLLLFVLIRRFHPRSGSGPHAQ